jgi:hypothetical protein
MSHPILLPHTLLLVSTPRDFPPIDLFLSELQFPSAADPVGEA